MAYVAERLIMISPSGINEAGKSIVENNERAQAASTGESTASVLGFVKPGAAIVRN